MRSKSMGRWTSLCGLVILVVLTALMPVSPGLAADVPERNSPTEHRAMREARAWIAERRWADAQRILAAHVVAEPRDADAHNLLGFSLRNLGRVQESLVPYRRALELDPGHLGAHEYIGEAYLQLGELARARFHLAALQRLCPQGCPELDDLRAAVAEAERARPASAPASAGAPNPR